MSHGRRHGVFPFPLSLLASVLIQAPAHAQVRMDLQLYRIDDQNFLVDFRNLGYRAIKPEPTPPSGAGTGALDSATPNTADELRARKPDHVQGKKLKKGNEVSSPYLFLECAVRLIVELASPAGGDAA